jgi:hypothetical protein
MLKFLSSALLAALLACPIPAVAQQSKPQTLRKFIIEREIPKVGSSSGEHRLVPTGFMIESAALMMINVV